MRKHHFSDDRGRDHRAAEARSQTAGAGDCHVDFLGGDLGDVKDHEEADEHAEDTWHA